jgi:hypothetical protein
MFVHGFSLKPHAWKSAIKSWLSSRIGSRINTCLAREWGAQRDCLMKNQRSKISWHCPFNYTSDSVPSEFSVSFTYLIFHEYEYILTDYNLLHDEVQREALKDKQAEAFFKTTFSGPFLMLCRYSGRLGVCI